MCTPLFDDTSTEPIFSICAPAKDMYQMYLEERIIESSTLQTNYIDKMEKGCGVLLKNPFDIFHRHRNE